MFCMENCLISANKLKQSKMKIKKNQERSRKDRIFIIYFNAENCNKTLVNYKLNT
jgi:hypothetical protein